MSAALRANGPDRGNYSDMSEKWARYPGVGGRRVARRAARRTAGGGWRGGWRDGRRAARRRAVGEADRSAEDLVDVAPAPGLAGLEAAHHRVLGLLEVLRGVVADRGVAAPDVAAGEAHPQVDPDQALPDAVLAALRGVRAAVLRGVLQVLAVAALGLGREDDATLVTGVPVVRDGEHRLLEVEGLHDLVEDVVVHGAGVADPQHLLALGLEHLAAQAPVGLVRARLVLAGLAQPLPGQVRPALSDGPELIHDLRRGVVVGESLELLVALGDRMLENRSRLRGVLARVGAVDVQRSGHCGKGQTLDQQ